MFKLFALHLDTDVFLLDSIIVLKFYKNSTYAELIVFWFHTKISAFFLYYYYTEIPVFFPSCLSHREKKEKKIENFKIY